MALCVPMSNKQSQNASVKKMYIVNYFICDNLLLHARVLKSNQK